MNLAIILASGEGRRMQKNKNKVLLKLNKRPIISYSMQAFEDNELIDKIFVVCKRGEKCEVEKIAKDFGISKFEKSIYGSDTRRRSGLNAMEYILNRATDFGKEDSVVLFHNAANPFVTQREISSCIKVAKKSGACVVAHQCKDTVKLISRQDFVRKTLKKRATRIIQTPQAMTLRIAEEAFERARRFKIKTTDDASLVEKVGRRVKVLPASEFNIKITTPIDFELAKILVKKLQN